MERSSLVTVARVAAAHGVRGEVRLRVFTQADEFFAPGEELFVKDEFGAGQWARIETSRPHKGGILVRFSHISDREAAKAIGGREVCVDRKRLPEIAPDEYYLVDTIGLEVKTLDGESLGKVESIIETGANDIFVVRGPDKETLIPALDWVIESVDVEQGLMIVDLPEGL